MTSRASRAARVLAAVAFAWLVSAPGCMMVSGHPEVEGFRVRPEAPPPKVPVAAAVRASVFEDGIHLRGEEAGEEYFCYRLLAQALSRAGIMARAIPRPLPDSLSLVVDVEEDRTGPVSLRVASMATLRLLPSWTRTRYRLRAAGCYRGRPLAPFTFEVRSTQIENVLLLPLAPFFAPTGARMRIRRQAVEALAVHVARALVAPPGEGRP